MSNSNSRHELRLLAVHREIGMFQSPTDGQGNQLNVTEYYGSNVFDFKTAKGIPEKIRKDMIELSRKGKPLSREHAEVVATAVTEWSLAKGATHFCHWFQPLTGGTAEKHDAFLNYTNGETPIEKLSASMLMQGEPDASSFPNGGSRSTFEARGYTAWDVSSPMFIQESPNGKFLTIPTAFVSYHGASLDVKTPLLRSISHLDKSATKFLNLIDGDKKVEYVIANCGPEQEYFLVDKAFYYARPDLVMTGRALFGSLTSRNQQLEDHYFGTIPERVLAFMQELDLELHLLGIPSKTRHNEVAPGQFELAQIFREANVAADNNQMIMHILKKVSHKHGFMVLLHEKPFAGINGSGKHCNWSMCDNLGRNLLDPGHEPEQNHRFLAFCAMACEAVYRNASALRAAVASHGNDHRLGANEAPPSIISVFLGDTLDKIYKAIVSGTVFKPDAKISLDIGAGQLAELLKDNTDRNRTSPFAFTGNKFEFRAVGSSQPIGFPLTILNAAMAEVINDSYEIAAAELKTGKTVDEVLIGLAKKWMTNCSKVVFNGDGYSEEWRKEAEKRGLPNHRTTADSLIILRDAKAMNFLSKPGIIKQDELETRYHVLVERYNKHRIIEFRCLVDLVGQYVIPAAVDYKLKLSELIGNQKNIGLESTTEKDIYKKINTALDGLYGKCNQLKSAVNELNPDSDASAKKIANELMPLSVEIAQLCNELEDSIQDKLWPLPTFFEMLFVR
jgi:glutamine synthetase